MMYEAYGPAGIALLIECLTDNRNRSASDVRVAVTRNGGTMADVGSTARMFARKGVVTVAKEQGGKSLPRTTCWRRPWTPVRRRSTTSATASRSSPTPTTPSPSARRSKAAGLDYDSAEVSFVPEYTQDVDAPTAEKLFKIIDALEDSDDVQNVYANFDASDDVLEAVGR